jgi:hypothetical protein
MRYQGGFEIAEDSKDPDGARLGLMIPFIQSSSLPEASRRTVPSFNAANLTSKSWRKKRPDFSGWDGGKFENLGKTPRARGACNAFESGDVFIPFSATAAQTRKLSLRSGLAL